MFLFCTSATLRSKVFFSKRAMLTHAHTKEICHIEERVLEQMEIKFKG